MSRFYDPDGNEITLEQWARDFQMPRHVADEMVTPHPRWSNRRLSQIFTRAGRDAWRQRSAPVRVSTVWLGLDHSFLAVGPPLIFETMVFGGEHDQYLRRYHTRHQALAGHDQIVAAIRDGEDPEEGW